MNRVLKAAASATAVLGIVAAGTGSAKADSGDGKVGCNRYEICFSMNSPDHRYQKHFFYSGSHDSYVWFDVVAKRATSIPVQNNASALANRDGSCDVKVVDDRGIYPDVTQTVANNPSTAAWVYLNKVNDHNDRHERVNCA